MNSIISVGVDFSGQIYKFACGRWLGQSMDDGSRERYMVGYPVSSSTDLPTLIQTCAQSPKQVNTEKSKSSSEVSQLWTCYLDPACHSDQISRSRKWSGWTPNHAWRCHKSNCQVLPQELERKDQLRPPHVRWVGTGPRHVEHLLLWLQIGSALWSKPLSLGFFLESDHGL